MNKKIKLGSAKAIDQHGNTYNIEKYQHMSSVAPMNSKYVKNIPGAK